MQRSYDNNQITCDGSVDMVNNEDINAKMRACGFDILEVEDGCYDINSIVQALSVARQATEKPTFINIKTTIGLGSAVAGKAAAHGAPFGAEDVKNMKRANGFDPEKHFEIDDDVRNFFAEIPKRGEGFVHEWNRLFGDYCSQFPELGQELQARMRGEIRKDWKDLIPQSFDTADSASRVAGGKVINPLAKAINSFLVGTADLSPSVNMAWDGKVDFQSVSESTFMIKNSKSPRLILVHSLVCRPNVASMVTILDDISIMAYASTQWPASPMVSQHSIRAHSFL